MCVSIFIMKLMERVTKKKDSASDPPKFVSANVETKFNKASYFTSYFFKKYYIHLK